MATTIAAMFDSALPALLSAQRARCAQIGGEYGFDIGGEGGGAWTLDFVAATVARGLPKKATLTIAMPASDFEKLLKGQLDVTAALKEGRVRITGDSKRLADLMSVLTGGAA